MKRGDVFTNKYLNAENLSGHTVTVTIECTNMEDITNPQTGKTEKKAVTYFRGKEKGLVINQINWDSIVTMYGEESDGWPGRQITLFATTTPFGNKIVPCIRIKPGQSAPVAQAEEFIQQQVAPQTVQTAPADNIPPLGENERTIRRSQSQEVTSDDDIPF